MTVVGRTGTVGARSREPRRRQVRVSFSGLDGAGKTRQIEALVAALGRGRTVEVLWVPFKIWPEPLLNRLPAGLRGRLGPKRGTRDPSPGGSTPAGRRGAAGRSLRWWVVASFAALSGGLSLRRRVRDSDADVIVLDRYRLDTVVKLQYWYSDVSGHWLARVVEALAPAPDLEFLLRVDPEVAYARKPEQWSVAQLARQARLYDGLAARPGRVVTLDAEDDPDSIARTVEAHVRAALDGA